MLNFTWQVTQKHVFHIEIIQNQLMSSMKGMKKLWFEKETFVIELKQDFNKNIQWYKT